MNGWKNKEKSEDEYHQEMRRMLCLWQCLEFFSVNEQRISLELEGVL
jgi:hypothetical protein